MRAHIHACGGSPMPNLHIKQLLFKFYRTIDLFSYKIFTCTSLRKTGQNVISRGVPNDFTCHNLPENHSGHLPLLLMDVICVLPRPSCKSDYSSSQFALRLFRKQ